MANDAGALSTLHATTRYVYDQNKPDGVAYHLPTTITVGGLPLGANMDTGALQDVMVTTNGYAPVDGAAILGGTSGWVHKQPTNVTVDAGQPTALTSAILYDAHGRPVFSTKPGSSGADAGTTLSILYTAGANAADAACGNRPEWAGQPCVTKAAGPVTGHDPTRMATNLPIKRVDAYNRYGSPTSVSETASGPVAGTSATQTRTTATTYDTADRVLGVQITGSGTGVGQSIRKTTTVYDTVTGEVTATRSVDGGGTTVASVTKSFDKLGRLVSYSDGAGSTSSTTYDRYGNPGGSQEVVSDAAGSRVVGSTVYTYDRAKDPRGYLTSFTDSVAGTVEATWGPDGQLESELLPGGVRLSIDYDPARVPVRRTYTRASDGVVITTDSVVENARGQWVRHDSATGSRAYTYDRLGRLTQVRDTAAMSGACTTRAYGFDMRSSRTQFAAATGSQGAVCPSVALATTSGYDSAERLVSSSGAGGSTWVYDPLGRVTTMPGADGVAVTNGYYVNDLVASQEVAGSARVSWGLDPLLRRSTFASSAWVDGVWAAPTIRVSHYSSDSDEPSWVAEGAADPAAVTRYVGGVEGDVAITTSLTGDRELQLVDLHGDVVATVPVADGAAEADWAGLAMMSFDEFGVAQPLTGSGAPTGPPVRYGWLGASQRSAEALGGVILMGSRLYSPAIGRFLQVDSVPGGSASAYDYCNADPVNCTDLDGNWPSWKGVLKAVAAVGEVASFIPGPVGAIAGGVAAVAYLVTGDKQKALLAAGGAVLGLVGLGAAVGAARAARGLAVGRNAAAAAAKIGRAVRAGATDAHDAIAVVSRARRTIGMAPGVGRELQVSERGSRWASRLWLGRGARPTPVGAMSRDGLRQARSITLKPKLGYSQINLESRSISRGRWTNNYHVRIR
ncbi:RHS repeat-associated core domain-containing protein [Cellulomonas hominis]